MLYQYIVSTFFIIIIGYIIYKMIDKHKQEALSKENILVSSIMILFFAYMIYERLID